MLQLILKDIADKFSKENFFRLERFIRDQHILEGQWQFYTIDIPAAYNAFGAAHKLSFVPRDVILLSAIGDQNFYFRNVDFDAQNIYVKTSGPVVLRFLAGSFLDKSYGNIVRDYPFVAPSTGGGGSTLSMKAGVETGASFAGSPRKRTVTFSTPFASSTYSVNISGIDSRLFTYESKTVNGFVINANAAAALSNEVSWVAIESGET